MDLPNLTEAQRLSRVNRSGPASLQCLFQVCDKVRRSLQSYRKAQQAFVYALGLAFLFWYISMGLQHRICNEAFHTAKAFSILYHLHMLQDIQGGSFTVSFKRYHGSEAGRLLH